VALNSEKLKIKGQSDLIEVHSKGVFLPVEYKRGKKKHRDWDRIQLCAQALCIEEMRDVRVEAGALWYWQSRRREEVSFDSELRAVTVDAIEGARTLLAFQKTPPPIQSAELCRNCSLKEHCRPDAFRIDRSRDYIRELFNS
jgi:CRISPR-associated exonuclease Cas4